MYKMEYPRGIQLAELVEKVKVNSAKSKEVPTGSSNLSKLVPTTPSSLLYLVIRNNYSLINLSLSHD